MDYFESVRDTLPQLFPGEMLKFFNLAPINLASKNQKLEVGKSYELPSYSVFDFLSTLKRENLYNPKFLNQYHNTALKIVNKLTNEGLLSPVGEKSGIFQKYRGNGYDARKAAYGYYDFLVFGFQEIRYHFDEAIRPIIVKANGDERIGTGFAVFFNKKQYFITAKHCLPTKHKIYFSPFLPNENSSPLNIYVAKDENIDVAIMEFSEHTIVSNKFFEIDRPFPLDKVMIIGYPPLAGTTDAIQVSTTGEITAISKTYWHTDDQIYVSARVKGGSSGSPVIAENGRVVGVIIETLKDIQKPDLPDELGFGVALSSEALTKLLNSINGTGEEIYQKLDFKVEDDNSFSIK